MVDRLIYEIPVRPQALSLYTIIRGRTFKLTTQYREVDEGGWIMDIQDADTGEDLIFGLPLVSGLDLLWQYNYINFGFHLIMQCIDGRTTPTYESLGVEDRLVAVVVLPDPVRIV